MTGLQLALPTAGDRTVGGIKSVWITPRRWVARWIHERSTQGGYGQVVGADYGRRGWSILTRNPVEGTLSYRQRAVSGGAFAYDCTLSLTINGYSLERRDWLEALTQGSDVAMMVQLVDGAILLMGEERGCRLTCDFDSGQRGRGAKITLNATHTTRAPLRTVPLDVAQRWVVPSLCEDTTMAAFCSLTMDDLCAAVPAELCPPVGPGGATLAIQLIPGPQGPAGAAGAPGAQGPPGPGRNTIFLTNYADLITITNIPAAAQLLPLENDFAFRGQRLVDFTGYTQARFVYNFILGIATGAIIYPIYRIFTGDLQQNSKFIAGWTSFGTDFELPLTSLPSPSGNVWRDTGWQTLPVGLENQIAFLWCAHQGGDGIADPQVANIQVMLQ